VYSIIWFMSTFNHLVIMCPCVSVIVVFGVCIRVNVTLIVIFHSQMLVYYILYVLCMGIYMQNITNITCPWCWDIYWWFCAAKWTSYSVHVMLIGRLVLSANTRDRCGISPDSCSENNRLFSINFGLECYYL